MGLILDTNNPSYTKTIPAKKPEEPPRIQYGTPTIDIQRMQELYSKHAQTASALTDAIEVNPETPLTGYTIVIIDDEPHIRELIGVFSEKMGSTNILKFDAPASTHLSPELDNSRTLFIVDKNFHNTGEDGVNYIPELREKYPGAKILLHSGEDTNYSGLILSKPATLDTFKQTVIKALTGKS